LGIGAKTAGAALGGGMVGWGLEGLGKFLDNLQAKGIKILNIAPNPDKN